MKRIPLLFLLIPILFGSVLAAQEKGVRVERPTGKKFAFLVGVTEYENSDNFRTLTYTVEDVKAWQKQLEGIGFESKNIVALTSDRSLLPPTKKKILDSMRELLKRVREDDILICMFSGHGTQNEKDQYFCPQDADVGDLAGSCVSLGEVFETMKKSPAKFKWLIVDACRNDPTKSRDTGLKSISKVKTVPKGVTAIFSCAETEYSHEHDPLKHGVFTYYLMKGLDGEAADKNGDVTILGLYDYVQKRTNDYVQTKISRQRTQVPYWDGQFTNFVIRENVNLKKAMEAYDRAQEYRRKKDYTNAAAEIKKALALVPKKQEFLDEKQHIELLASAGTKPPVVVTSSETVKPPVQSGQNAGDRKVITVKGVSYAFRWCPAGKFMMGSPTSELGRFDDEKQHEVTLTKGFWMLETEVTQEMWQSVMGENPSYFKDSKKLPVERVSWEDCQDYIRKLNALGVAPAGYKFSLPTESQWEYACRAGTTTALNNGKNLTSESRACPNLSEVGWYDENSGAVGLKKAHEVGKKKANAWGLFDMHGNVLEWCLDWYGSYPDGSVTDPTGPDSGSSRVLRGGLWDDNAGHCRSANRDFNYPSYRSDFYGARLALVRD